MAGFRQFFTIFLMEFINIGPVYIRGWREGRGGGVGGGKSLIKEEIRHEDSYDVCMHPQRANIPLQGLDRRALTVGAISGPHSQPGALLWRHFTTSCGFPWSAKSIQGKQTSPH